MDKNAIVAIILIFLVLMVFQLLYFKPWVEKPVQEGSREIVEEESKDQTTTPLPAQEGIDEAESAKEEPSEPQEKPEARTVSVETNNFIVKISTAGAGISSLKLKKYMNRDGTPIELVERNEGDVLPFEVRFKRLRTLSDQRSKTIYHVEKLSEIGTPFLMILKITMGTCFVFQRLLFFRRMSMFLT